MEGETTTIQIKKEDAKRLEKLKYHPAQPIKEVVHELLEEKESEEVMEETIRQRWDLIIKLCDLKGQRKEEIVKRGYA